MAFLDETGLRVLVEHIKDEIAAVGSGGESPADYVVAQGTSGIWDYIKFANGLAICAGSIAFNNISFTAWGSVYEGNVGRASYPFTFTKLPKVTFTPDLTGGEALLCVEVAGAGTTTQTPHFYVMKATNTRTCSGYVHVQAIGRWK